MKSEVSKPVAIGAIVFLVVAVALGLTLFFRSSSEAVGFVQPKPWGGPPGGFAKYRTGVRGAPSAAPPAQNGAGKN